MRRREGEREREEGMEKGRERVCCVFVCEEREDKLTK